MIPSFASWDDFEAANRPDLMVVIVAGQEYARQESGEYAPVVHVPRPAGREDE